MAMQTAPNGKVDRQTTTPFHLKLFYRTGSFHSPTEFPTSTPTPLPPHLQIYTWPTCTLRELSHLLVSALPSLLPNPAIGTRLAYRLVYPDTHNPHPAAPGRYLSKELGNVVIGSEEGGRGLLPTEDEEKLVPNGIMAGLLEGAPDKTLQDARFVIGDYISCAIFPPLADGAVAPPPGRGVVAGRGRADYGPGRAYGGGFRGRGGMRGGGMFNGDRLGGEGVPAGEWRRGERVPEGPGGYGRGRGRAY
ncbi:hypothetical protein N7G274_008422 [Stereocaulon virgatum]|uniref:Histone deacetylase complex subunit SAP18 n=1 Tax=Stereocaulon virgatum TaxID=373712 RepID=A0ABR3ZZ37_9LECA